MADHTYKETLNLPSTAFPMRANLANREEAWLASWEQAGKYQALFQAHAGQTRYTLADGPPYANGPIHMGHAVNKVLKDMILAYQMLGGHQTTYVPGWDCHGLPIELKVEKKIGKPGRDI